jgi:hypothetical protein
MHFHIDIFILDNDRMWSPVIIVDCNALSFGFDVPNLFQVFLSLELQLSSLQGIIWNLRFIENQLTWRHFCGWQWSVHVWTLQVKI